MFLRTITSVFLILVSGVVFDSICSAAPLMVEKNLFSTDRKPPSPETDVSQRLAGPSMAVGNLQLDGVIIQNNTKKAILRIKNKPADRQVRKGQPASPFISVREGQMVNDYRVSKIEPKSISLEKDGQTYTIGLFAENKVVSPPSPIPTPIPAPVAPPAQPPEANQPTGPRLQAGDNPQPVPGQAAPAPGHNVRAGRSRNRNAQVPEPPQEPDQPVETIEEE